MSRNADDLNMGGERGLWMSVILTAIDDANGNVKGSRDSTVTADRLRVEARDWLTKPNKGFNEVCHLAGLDPVAVRDRCRLSFKVD